jgi:copper chaperone CopZ
MHCEKGDKMNRAFFAISGVLLLLALFSLFLYSGAMTGAATLFPVPGYGTNQAQEKGLSIVIFKVKCYEEGKVALQGLNGIQKIETGFHDVQETDTVYYDPKVITIEEMETALKKAGTYVETMKKKERN